MHRSAANPALDRLDAAIGRALADLSGPDRTGAENRLAELYWRRYRLLAGTPGVRPDMPELALGRALGWLRGMAARQGTPTPRVHRLLGMALYTRYQRKEDPEDLEAAARHLAAADQDVAEVLVVRAAALGDRAWVHQRVDDARAAVALLERACAGPAAPLHVRVQLALARLAAHRGFAADEQVPPLLAEIEALLGDVPADSPVRPVFLILRGMVLVSGGVPERNEENSRVLAEALAAWRDWNVDARTDPEVTGFPAGEVTDVPPRLRALFRVDDGVDQLARLTAAYEALPDGDERRTAGYHLAALHLQFALRGEPVDDHEYVIGLLRDALPVRPDDANWQIGVRAALASVLGTHAAHGDPERTAEAVRLVQEALALCPPGHPSRTSLEELLGSMMSVRHQYLRSGADIDAAIELLRTRKDNPALTDYTRLQLRGHYATMLSVRGQHRGDPVELGEAVDLLRECVAALPRNDVTYPVLSNCLGVAEIERAVIEFRADRPVDRDACLRAAERVVGSARAGKLTDRERAAMLTNGGGALAVASAVLQDPGSLDQAVTMLEEALALSPPGDEDRIRTAAGLGSCHAMRYEARRDPADIALAVRWLTEATDQLSDPGHHLWFGTQLNLARAHRLRAGRGDAERGRTIGLRALRGHAWRVLLQTGTADAALAARSVVDNALEVAAWCLADRAYAEAVTALDACRGLVLHSATVTGDIPAQLLGAGEADLAEEWRRTAPEPGDVPTDLRYRVLRALTGGSGAGRLLDPPDPADIGAALRSGGVDALVYLVPRTSYWGGTALVVPARGRPSLVALPGLYTGAPQVAGYLAARLAEAGYHVEYTRPEAYPPDPDLPPAAHPSDGGFDPSGGGHRPWPSPSGNPEDRDPRTDRDAGPARPHRPATVEGALEPLCDWAWQAAMGPLLAHCRGLDLPRVPRLALVPMGELGLVPWHAARTRHATGPTGHRYALHDAVISYAASARLLVDVLGRPPGRPGAPALIVGDPGGDLPGAGLEAAAVHAAFHPGATFLGRHPDGRAGGAGTPREVLDWLRAHPDAGLLHLACHATASPRAELTLAGGALAADRLAALAGAGGALDLVALAGCATHVSGHGHDDAYSLATAFLVAGARTAVGSLWRVPDDVTSLLMFVFHHYLSAGVGPAEALRRAQIWMTDPAVDRGVAVPPALAVGRTDRLIGWAGFTHLGR
ncbi:CHAT domain-containing protein [Longispora sp. NPDC051575]|uniref:CHAT domain-containing protein n=1 Tax=Longispora sp. NPDC051575 TaxID=3154943 RepID=UPI00342F8554